MFRPKHFFSKFQYLLALDQRVGTFVPHDKAIKRSMRLLSVSGFSGPSIFSSSLTTSRNSASASRYLDWSVATAPSAAELSVFHDPPGRISEFALRSRREAIFQRHQDGLPLQVRRSRSHTGRPPILAGYAGDQSASQPRLNVLLPEQIRLIFAPTNRLTSGLGLYQRSSLEWLVEPRPLLLRTSAPPRRNPCRDKLHMLAHN